MARGLNCSLSKLSLVATAAITLMMAGCANQQGISNPFTTADRVPPPTTRALAPGSGQPYYQGDPLPPMPPTGQQLRSAPVTFAAAPQPATVEPPTPSQGVVQVAHNEPAVAIPTDSSDLRLAYVPPAPPTPAPVAQPRPIQPQRTVAAAPAAREVVAIPAARQVAAEPRPVQLAVVNAPGANRPGLSQPSLPQFSESARSADGLPWVSGSAPRSAPQPVQVVAAPVVSPNVAPSGLVRVASAAPRVRLPGYPAPQQTFVTPATAGPVASPAMGRVQITELPPQTYMQPSPRPSSSNPTDGFRARETNFQRQSAARPPF